MGYTSFTSGQTTATSGILVIFLAPIIGANIHKFDARKLTVFGFVTFSIISVKFVSIFNRHNTRLYCTYKIPNRGSTCVLLLTIKYNNAIRN